MSEPFLTSTEVDRIIRTTQRMASRTGQAFIIDPAKLRAAWKETAMSDIVVRLQNAMHLESAIHAPRTTEAIEAMRAALGEIASIRAHAEQLSSDYDLIAVQNAGLRVENERLREALNEIAQWYDGDVGPHMDEPASASTARAALKEENA